MRSLVQPVPFAILAFVVFAVAAAVPAGAQQTQARLVQDAVDVFVALSNMPEREVPAFMVKDAWGIAIFPGMRKFGLVVGLQRGNGVLVTRSKDGGWGPPLLISLSGGTVGWQIGVQSVDLVLFFRTRESVDQVLRGGLTLGVDVAVAAGGFGRQAGAGTDVELLAEIVSYARTRGFFAGATISSAAISPDDAANAAYYGVDRPRADDILAGKMRAAPPSAAALRAAIEAQAGRARQ